MFNFNLFPSKENKLAYLNGKYEFYYISLIILIFIIPIIGGFFIGYFELEEDYSNYLNNKKSENEYMINGIIERMDKLENHDYTINSNKKLNFKNLKYGFSGLVEGIYLSNDIDLELISLNNYLNNKIEGTSSGMIYYYESGALDRLRGYYFEQLGTYSLNKKTKEEQDKIYNSIKQEKINLKLHST